MVATALNLLTATPKLGSLQASLNGDATTTFKASAKNSISGGTVADQHFSRMIEQSTADQRVQTREDASARSTDQAVRRRESARDSKDTDDSSVDTADRDREITPADASTILASMANNTTTTAMNPAATDALKDQLQQIVDTNTPQTVGTILDAVATASTGTQALLSTNLDSDKELSADLTDTIQQTLALLDQSQAAPTAPTTATQIIPLAQQLVLPQATNDNTTTSPSQDAIAISDTTPRPSMGTLIPSLKSDASDDKATTLPDISLPSTAPGVHTTDGMTDFERQIQSATTQSQQFQDGMKQQVQSATTVDAAKTIDTKTTATSSTSSSSVSDITAINPSGGVSAPQSAAAVTAASKASSQTIVPVKEQVVVAVRQASKDGITDITIQLDPLDMGRVTVKMHTGSDGQTSLSFTADKPETFDALSRDARSLEKSLQESGIKADTSSMQFNLRQQPQPQHQSSLSGDTNGQYRPQQQASLDSGSSTASSSTATAAAMTRTYRLDVKEGVDIHA